MELVDNDLGFWDDRYAGIPVRCPHVHRDILNAIFAIQLMQVTHHDLLVAVRQQFNDGVVLDVGDHATRPDQVDFVDTHPLRNFETDGFLQLVDVVAEY